VATSVLPSPVFISAILPRCSTMPPISCTSKCRMFSVRAAGLAHDGEGLGQQVVERLAVVRPLAELRVRPRSASSESAWIAGSNALIAATSGRMRFSSRSFCVPMTLARIVSRNMLRTVRVSF
jgi:hypothetical protein